MNKILIVGATSAIAAACAQQWASQNAQFFLVGRNAEKLKQIADDLSTRTSGQVRTYVLDLNQLSEHPRMLNACCGFLKQIDIALVAHGSLSDQKKCEENVDLALMEFSSNCLSVISLLTLLANHMEKQKSGTIAVISSVAGERGRYSNYLYGTAKAAVSTFCEGLRARLYHSGVHVLTIKPGYVATPMTRGLPLPKLLVATPEKVAKDIVQAVKRQKNTLYTPHFWAGWMFVVRSIPNAVFKKLKV